MTPLTFPWVIQASLKAGALGSSVEEVEQLICKHNTFQKVLTAQDEKVIGSERTGHGQESDVVGEKRAESRNFEEFGTKDGVLGAHPQVMVTYGDSLWE